MGRPAKGPKEKLIEIPCAVPPDVDEEIQKIAGATDRSRSQIARKMVWRGLMAYRRDGSLDEPAETITGKKTAQVKPVPLDASQGPQKVKATISSNRKGGKK